MNNIAEIYNLVQEISWNFGSQGLNGECCGDLSFVEFMALKRIYEIDNITIQEIGNALNITKGGASKIIDRIEAKGYASRETSPVDGRVCCVKLTEKGACVLKDIVDKYTTYVASILSEYEQDEIERVKSALKILDGAIHKKATNFCSEEK